MMEFYFPDSQDQIDPRYNFIDEQHPPFHVRQRDDLYAYEALDRSGIAGVLVSKGIVDGVGGTVGRYTVAQRHRMYRIGVHRFFRLAPGVKALGDCGAFSYVDHDEPPITPDDAIDFYEGCRFDAGVSVDHVILAYRPDRHATLFDDDGDVWEHRQQITLDYASTFLTRHRVRRCRFEPVGVAQGWSPSSYAHSVAELQQMGYTRIALGGMVPLKTPQIIDVLSAISDRRHSVTRLHLFGVTRTQMLPKFRALGVTSFDSTSPFRQAFMDDRDNYYWPGEPYTAVRVPPVDGNARLKRRIKSNAVDQAQALKLEAACLGGLRALDQGRTSDIDATLEILAEYHTLFDDRDRVHMYRRLLEDQPWKQCTCGICAKAGIEVAIFRGSERNKRRGFHNLAIFIDGLGRRINQQVRNSESLI